MRRLRRGSSRTLSGETCLASAGGKRLRSRRRGGQKCPTGLRAGVSKGRSSVEVPVMGMEPRAERKDGEDTMTTAKARKPKGGADVCLAVEGSTPSTTLMQQALTRENLQRAWEQVKANHGAPGIDGMTVEQFPDFIRSPQWASVRKALRTVRTCLSRSDGCISPRTAEAADL